MISEPAIETALDIAVERQRDRLRERGTASGLFMAKVLDRALNLLRYTAASDIEEYEDRVECLEKWRVEAAFDRGVA